MCLETVHPEQLLHKPDECPLPRDFPRVHPGTDQTLLFVLEQPWVVIGQIAALCVELFTFIVHILAWRDSDALHVPALLGFAECHAVEVDAGVVTVAIVQGV